MDCDNPVMIHHDPSVHIPKIFQRYQRYPKDIPTIPKPFPQWEFQDPKMEVRKRTIFWAIFSGDIPLHRPEK